MELHHSGRLIINPDEFTGSTPSGHLHINTSVPTSQPVSIANCATVQLSTFPSGTGTQGYLGKIAFGGGEGAPGWESDTNFNGAYIAARGTNDYTLTSSPTELQFWTTPSGSRDAEQRLTIANNGNIGIGIAAPTYLLDVAGTARISGQLILNTPSSPGYMYLESGGEVTTKPVLAPSHLLIDKLTLKRYGDTRATIETRQEDDQYTGTDYKLTTYFTYPFPPLSDAFDATTGIGIENFSQDKKYRVTMNLTNKVATHSCAMYFRIHMDDTPGYQSQTPLAIDHSGSVQLPSYAAGTLQVDGSGKLTTSSDVRLKHDIVPLSDGALAAVMALNPVTYKWNSEASSDERTQVGFIADDVMEVIPDAVDGKKYDQWYRRGEQGEPVFDEDGNLIFDEDAPPRYKGLNTTVILAYNVKATQELCSAYSDLYQSHKELVKKNESLLAEQKVQREYMNSQQAEILQLKQKVYEILEYLNKDKEIN